MPQGAGDRFRRLLTGLLVLVLLVIGPATANAALASVRYAGLGTSTVGMDDGGRTATATQACPDASTPWPTSADTDGAVCCLTLGCSVGTVAQPAAVTVMRMHLASGVTYRSDPTVHPGGFGQAPALPPPAPSPDQPAARRLVWHHAVPAPRPQASAPPCTAFEPRGATGDPAVVRQMVV
jgi:hypothetical protein